jgi:hypothetical protein
MDYTKLSDEELMKIVDPNVNKGGIPLAAVKEAEKRGLKKGYRGTYHS